MTVLRHGVVLAATLALLLDGDPREGAWYALGNAVRAELAMTTSGRLVQLDPGIPCELS